MVQQVQTSSKVQYAYEAIKQRILDGVYGSGARLVMSQLARDLAVSPVPIREAFRRLEAEGWVIFIRNHGPRVAPVDLNAYHYAIEALALIEGHVTAQSVSCLDKAALVSARGANDRLLTALGKVDLNSFKRWNLEFHTILCGACPNALLLSLFEREWQRVELAREVMPRLVPEQVQMATWAEHEALLELIDSGASTAIIEGYARQHRLRITSLLAMHSPPAPEPSQGSAALE